MKLIIAPIVALVALTGPETQLAYFLGSSAGRGLSAGCSNLTGIGVSPRKPSQAETRAKRAERRESPLLIPAERGDAEAQYRLGVSLINRDARFNKPGAMKWLCRAADQGHANARGFIAYLYKIGHQAVGHSDTEHYMWLSLAAAAGDQSATNARDDLAKRMTPAQIAKAKRLVKAWKPGQCEFKAATRARVGG